VIPSVVARGESPEAILVGLLRIEIAAHLPGARNDKREIVVCENRNTKM